MPKHGLKDHHISQLGDAITKDLKDGLMMALPDYFRVIIGKAIVDYLEKNGLRIDKK